MSKRGKKYTADFKTKVILELLEGEQTLNQICSKHEVTPKTVKEWKATFLANASLAFQESHYLVKDSGTSQSPKSTRQREKYFGLDCPASDIFALNAPGKMSSQ